MENEVAATTQMGQQKWTPEQLALAKALNIPVPKNIKEISTKTEFSSDTKKILIPKGMSKLAASVELRKQYDNEEQVIDSFAQFEGWNWKDVLVAVKKVTEVHFGWMNAKTVFTPFGNIKPMEVDVVTDVIDGKHTIEKAFYGTFCISAFSDAKAQVNINNQGECNMVITAKRKHSEEVTEYYNLIRTHLETKSIYRGKSIVVTRGGGGYADFEIIENKGSSKIVLNEKEEVVVKNFVVDCLGEKGKRTYLFVGGYGTGKTESAMRVGREAVAKGMSFFYIKDASVFTLLLNQAKKYSPALLFLEDLDQIGAGEQRDEEMNNILNTLDGVQTKGNDLTVIFTTNHVDKINSALRRPGRIDLVVQFANPNVVTKEKIYRLYFEGITGANELDYTKLVAETGDVQGAVIAEICKRALQLAKKHTMINNDHVLSAIASIEYQIQLMKDEVSGKSLELQYVELQRDLFTAPIIERIGELEDRL